MDGCDTRHAITATRAIGLVVIVLGLPIVGVVGGWIVVLCGFVR